MSALPPKADMCDATRNVRYGPIADIRTIRDQKTHRFHVESIVMIIFAPAFCPMRWA
jgi:hypothetical protein